MTLRPNPFPDDDDKLLALAIWREARGECYPAKLGVSHVIRNRCAIAPAQGFAHDVPGNVLKPYAFSSFNPGDPNAEKFPDPHDQAWLDSLRAAESDEADPTGNAVFYFSRPLTTPPRAWGDVEHTADLGGLHFYRIPAYSPAVNSQNS